MDSVEKIENKIGEYINRNLDQIGGEENLIDLFLFLHSGKIIKYEDYPNFSLSYESDGEFFEINCFDEFVEKIKFYAFSSCQDDVFVIQSYLKL